MPVGQLCAHRPGVQLHRTDHAPNTPCRAPSPADPKAPGARDLVTRWLAGFLEVGSLVKRLDTGEGSYAIELEEDVGVYDALGQVCGCAGAGGAC